MRHSFSSALVAALALFAGSGAAFQRIPALMSMPHGESHPAGNRGPSKTTNAAYRRMSQKKRNQIRNRKAHR